MRVGSFFLLCMMSGAAAGLAYAADGVYAAWTSTRAANAARHELLAFRAAFRVPEMVQAERVVAVGQLTAAEPAGEAERQALATARRTTDAAIDAAAAAAVGTKAAIENGEALRAAAGHLGGLRQKVDGLTALPRAQRPANALAALQPAQLAYFEITRMLTRMQAGDNLQDSVIQDHLDLSRMAYALRQWAAQRGTGLIGAISSGRPMTPAMLEDLATSVGHLDEVWDQILTMQATRPMAAPVQAAIATVQARYFGENGKLYGTVVAAGRGDGAYPKIADFRRDHAQGVMTPFLIRDAALDRAIERAETLSATALVRLWVALAMLLGVCAIVAFATWLFTRRVVTALTGLTHTITVLAGRDNAVAVPFRQRRDEVGRMAEAIEILRGNAVAHDELAERSAEEHAVRQLRAERVGQLCEAFHGETQVTIDAALASAVTMRDGALTSSGLVAEVERRTLGVVATTGQAAHDVRAIVTTAEHLSTSIGALAEQVGNSGRIAAQAESAVSQATTRMDELTGATRTIGTVTSLIQQIAAQTNLLALNATIEAARAGEAGRGFAVVAGEVKALAHQTARATDDIASQIALVQAATTGVADMIGEIFQTITEINRLGQSVAGAVEDQKKATAEIGQFVYEAATGIGAVSADMNDVQAIAARTNEAAGQTTESAARLTRDAQLLTGQIEDFLGRVRAA